MSQAFDLIVVGGGPGGYVAAFRAAQLGLRTAIVEKTPALGGTCLHWGCIPTKVLLHAAEFMEEIELMKEYGITVKGASFDWPTLLEKKKAVVQKYVSGLDFLAKRGKIEVIEGVGSIPAAGQVKVTPAKGKGAAQTITAKAIIVATGSEVATIPGLELDHKKIISSDDALYLDKLPKSMVVLGGGAVGVEFASLFKSFGVDVTVVEMLPALLPMMEPEVSKELERNFKKRKIGVKSGTKFAGVTTKNRKLHVKLEGKKNETVETDMLLVAIGRRPVTAELGLEKLGVAMDGRFVKVDGYLQTNVPGIYAIGDVVKTLALAHLASEEGIVAVEHAAGRETHPINHDQVPSNVYTLPEVAAVGLTEAEAKEKGYDVKVGKFPFSANSKSAVVGHTEGFVKIVTDKKYGEILGVHMIGPHVTELLAGPTGIMASEGTVDELARTIHAHPTLSEAVHEAALAAIDGAIHA
ncbi:MAG: dihydrolipoyl dehydrogenase [Gemmatimonadetes bacterium]|nr:dihydrolipoyl dehydrogenase [Gemmatimonadota bacterium]